jgi:hypothetical protein
MHRREFHTCLWPGCKILVSPKLWGCRRHWCMLPLDVRMDIQNAYKEGQERSETLSREYREALRRAREWITNRDTTGEDER